MSEEIELHIHDRFEIVKKIGKGAYGVVWRAIDKKTGNVVALKKIFDAFQNATDAQRTYREVMYLRHFRSHKNIIGLYDTMRAYNNSDLYMAFELMETDLHAAIRAKILKDAHQPFIMYQLLKALKFIHSADVVHRDLKPCNLLLNSDCTIKLADFGLARSIIQNSDGGQPLVSDYVATRWYRAPEILLGSQRYSKAVDMWSVGCILAELLTGRVLFAGKSSLHQIELVVELLGMPSPNDLLSMNVEHTSEVLANVRAKKSKRIDEIFSGYSPEALSLLKQLLTMCPEKRISAEQALAHPYFSRFRKPKEEMICVVKPCIPIDDNKRYSIKMYRDVLYDDSQANRKNSIRISDKSYLPAVIRSKSGIKQETQQNAPLQFLDTKQRSLSKLANKSILSRDASKQTFATISHSSSVQKHLSQMKSRPDSPTKNTKAKFSFSKKISVSKLSSINASSLITNIIGPNKLSFVHGIVPKRKDTAYSLSVLHKARLGTVLKENRVGMRTKGSEIRF